MSEGWYEVWADEGHEVPYLLLLRPCAAGFEVLDPAQGNSKAFETSNYEEAKNFLLEDEFTLIGRKQIEEGAWPEPGGRA